MNKKQLDEAAHRYMKSAAKRFRKSAKVNDDSEFGAGFTWGAVAGYKAGYQSAMRKRAAARR
jgi:hypothetical protein